MSGSANLREAQGAGVGGAHGGAGDTAAHLEERLALPPGACSTTEGLLSARDALRSHVNMMAAELDIVEGKRRAEATRLKQLSIAAADAAQHRFVVHPEVMVLQEEQCILQQELERIEGIRETCRKVHYGVESAQPPQAQTEPQRGLAPPNQATHFLKLREENMALRDELQLRHTGVARREELAHLCCELSLRHSLVATLEAKLGEASTKGEALARERDELRRRLLSEVNAADDGVALCINLLG
eukprot:NODE_17802_length_925_cov_4.551378.p1 GENE.NODE_17802_length_925_cov_4.551378~~NODE_17802_length_925_cov_4.551378.p1  ORF type:complete len:244 (+),score=82.73 NODE_17802_length_925_cov_4.551378:86-817(+)